ncbi:acetylcholine receptor subunit alpha-type acr-16-like [Oratosquilla oratoria]|uniref:acetylcholine receptor subunit alpha-type acr-16-like n=1 Tax=Oratosquilla oratoria TaxID=337810 RepID=UPI003F76EBAF
MDVARMILGWIILVFVSLASAEDDEGTDWWTQEQRVRKKVLENYDKGSLPRRDFNGTTTVHMHVEIFGVTIDDATQIMSVNSWVWMLWNDQRLKWDYKDYGGLNVIFFGADEIWKPDIIVYNNAKINEIDHYGDVHLIALKSGTVYWIPPAEMHVECPQDLRYWPYDKQSCTVLLGSWTTHGWQMNLMTWHGNITKLELTNYLKLSHHWQITEAHLIRNEMYYECCPEPYITIELKINLVRVSPAFVYTVVFPGLGIALMTLVQFLLPYDSTKKLIISSCTAVLTCIYVIYLATAVPPQGNSCPIILRFFGQTLVMVVISVVLTAIVLRLASGHHTLTTAPHPKVKVLLTGPLSKVLLTQDMASQVGRSFGLEGDDEQVLDAGQACYTPEWQLVAASLDRIVCYLYVIILTISLLAYVAPLA